MAIHAAQEVQEEDNIIRLTTRTDHWTWNLLGGANEAVMYESVKQGRVGLNIVFESDFALRNLKGGGEGSVWIWLVEVEKEGGDMGWRYGIRRRWCFTFIVFLVGLLVFGSAIRRAPNSIEFIHKSVQVKCSCLGQWALSFWFSWLPC